MAGLYPDVPGPRMAYHRDGSVGFRFTVGDVGPTVLSTTQMQQLNDEADTTFWNTDSAARWYWGMVFPELRDIAGFFSVAWFSTAANLITAETSTNTTNGMDGTWTDRGTVSQQQLIANYRTAITAAAWPGVKAVRLFGNWTTGSGSRTVKKLHLYGPITAGEPRFLLFTDTSDVEITGPYFDFADDGRGLAPEDKTFKIKNGHATSTANGIVLSVAALSVKSPTQVDDYTFSSDGTTFTATLNIGDLAPGASSGTLHVRRTTPATAALGLETGTFIAAATSWT